MRGLIVGLIVGMIAGIGLTATANVLDAKRIQIVGYAFMKGAQLGISEASLAFTKESDRDSVCAVMRTQNVHYETPMDALTETERLGVYLIVQNTAQSYLDGASKVTGTNCDLQWESP